MLSTPIRSPIIAVAWLALAACGGEIDATARAPARVDAAPVVATLAPAPGGGVQKLRAGDLPGARAAFEATLTADPDRMGSLNDLAVSYSLEGRFDAARQLLDEVVARGGSREQQTALLNLGELYALEGYVSAATVYFETARGIDTTRPEPVFALALLADLRGDPAAALSLAREAMRLDEGGIGRASFAFLYPEERTHLEALIAQAQGDRDTEAVRWRELRSGRFPALAATAQRHLDEVQ